MSATFLPGQIVQTPLGKGIVQQTRRNGRVLVQVHDRAVLLAAEDITPVNEGRRGPRRREEARRRPDTPGGPGGAVGEVDLHGLTVAEALARAEEALSDALLADLPALRLVHGRSGGRIRAALHRRLAGIPTVRRFSLDPRNPGVTVVTL
jgi:DNA mismatch repair protein MutS2